MLINSIVLIHLAKELFALLYIVLFYIFKVLN